MVASKGILPKLKLTISLYDSTWTKWQKENEKIKKKHDKPNEDLSWGF